MALVYKMAADAFEKLADDQKKAYKKNGDVYVLDVEGLPEPEDVSGLKAKVEQLLSEKKAVAKEREAALAEASRIEREKAEKTKDFEALFKSSEEERKRTEARLSELSSAVVSEKVANVAMAIANDIADKPTSAELLAVFIKPRLKYNDGQMQILNDKGEPTVATIDDLKKEIAGSGKFDPLIKGNKSGGGGAEAGKGGGAAVKTITRQEFDKLGDSDRMKHIKTGGTVTET